MEILLDDGSLTNDADAVMDKWKTSFCDLLNPNHISNENEPTILSANTDCNDDLAFNRLITEEEVIKAVKEMKLNKASGIDEIPAEI